MELVRWEGGSAVGLVVLVLVVIVLDVLVVVCLPCRPFVVARPTSSSLPPLAFVVRDCARVCDRSWVIGY